MTEITIIEKARPVASLDDLSKDERKILFETLSDVVLHIPRKYFIKFDDIHDKVVEYNSLQARPDIEELLLRKIIEAAHYLYREQFDIYRQISTIDATRDIITPIVDDFVIDETLVSKRARYVGSGYSCSYSNHGGSDKKYGGLIPKRALSKRQLSIAARPNIPGAKKGIRVRFDSPVYVSTPSGKSYVISDNEEINIIGIRAGELCNIKHRAIFLGALSSGNYSYSMISNDCSDIFGYMEHKLLGETTVMFEEKDAFTRLPAIFDRIVNLVNFFNSNIAARITSGKISLLTLNKPIIKQSAESPAAEEEDNIVNLLNEIIGRDVNSKERSVILLKMGLLDLYHMAKMKGKDSKEVSAAVDRLLRIAENRKQREKIKLQYINLKYREGLIKMFVEKRLGSNVLSDFERKLTLKPQLVGDKILELLPANQRNMVLDEIALRQKHYEAAFSNKCPHIKLYRRYRNALSDERAENTYKELERYMPKYEPIRSGVHVDHTNYLKCVNCGFDIICPHIRELHDLHLKKARFDALKSAMTKYIDDRPLQGNYYCRICHEVVANVEMYGAVMADHEAKIYSSISDELRTLMWGEIAGILRYVKMGALINVPRLIHAAIAGIYEYIFEIEKQLLKSKTNTVEDVKNKKRLFVNIYAYAYFVHLILNNKSGEMFDFKDMGKIAKSPKASDYLKYAVVTILRTKNAIISQISGMTDDFVKNKVIDAYKLIAAKGTMTMQFSDAAEDAFAALILDPIYHYMYYINMIDTGRAKLSLDDAVDKVEFVMGIKNVTELGALRNTYEKARIPAFDAKWKLNDFDKYKLPSDYKTAMKGYIARSFQLFHRRFALIDEFMYENRDVAPAYTRYFESIGGLLATEKAIQRAKMLLYVRSPFDLPFVASRMFERKKISIGRVYDEDGKTHKFGLAIIADEKDPMKFDDIAGMIEAGKRFTGKIIDRKCSVCGVLWSAIDKLDEKKIRESLRRKTLTANFFHFYKHRCPKGGLHEWKDTACTKCELSINVDIESKEALEYFGKFKSQYLDERNEEETVFEDKDVEMGNVLSWEKYADELAGWTFNLNKIIDITSKTKANTNAFLMIGGYEGLEYDDIKSGKIKLEAPESRDDARIYMIVSYIQMFMTEYNNLRYYYSVIRPIPQLASIMEDSGIKKHEYEQLPQILPELLDDFYTKLVYFKHNRTPLESTEYCLEFLASRLLLVWDMKDDKTKKMRHAFVGYFMRKTLKSEELKTVAGQVNWNLFRPVVEADEQRDLEEGKYDQNYDDDAGLETKEDLDEKIEEAAEENIEYGDTNEVMENKFDVDLEPDQDYEDFENEVGVEDTGVSGMD